MVLYKYMKSFRNYAHNLSGNTHVRSKIYREVVNEGHYVRISDNLSCIEII